MIIQAPSYEKYRTEVFSALKDPGPVIICTDRAREFNTVRSLLYSSYICVLRFSFAVFLRNVLFFECF